MGVLAGEHIEVMEPLSSGNAPSTPIPAVIRSLTADLKSPKSDMKSSVSEVKSLLGISMR